MAKWSAFPHAGEFSYDPAMVRKLWKRLHSGDAEPLPQDDDVLAAWAHFHNGDFQRAVEAGLKAGGGGITVANKAMAIHANYLEKKDKNKFELLMEVAERARVQSTQDERNPNAWYWQAYALGRYSQGISVAKALAQGLGSRVKEALEKTIALQPKHADAHVALGAFHAEVIDKVGTLIGGMTYGAKKETGLRLFQQALEIFPASPIAMIEYANGLVMLEGEKKLKDATRLYEQAAATKPMDATERLDIELAKAELDN
jgi:tetratricopeptide (TPR) repeat protein